MRLGSGFIKKPGKPNPSYYQLLDLFHEKGYLKNTQIALKEQDTQTVDAVNTNNHLPEINYHELYPKNIVRNTLLMKQFSEILKKSIHEGVYVSSDDRFVSLLDGSVIKYTKVLQMVKFFVYGRKYPNRVFEKLFHLPLENNSHEQENKPLTNNLDGEDQILYFDQYNLKIPMIKDLLNKYPHENFVFMYKLTGEKEVLSRMFDEMKIKYYIIHDQKSIKNFFENKTKSHEETSYMILLQIDSAGVGLNGLQYVTNNIV